MSQNQVKIYYNPFKKTIKFFRLSLNNEWKKCDSPNGKLLKFQTNNYAIQNCGKEIIKLANEEWNYGNIGLHIIFCGTNTDYLDFKIMIEKFLLENNNVNLTGEYDKNNVLPEGKDAIEVINSNYLKIKEEFSDYLPESKEYINLTDKQQKIGEYIQKYSEISNSKITVCVMGNYSVGKSTFINAIIGEEILPSSPDPETAKVVEIINDNKYEIKFKFDNFPISIKWENNKYSYHSEDISFNIDKIKNRIDECIKHKEGTINQIYSTMKVFNKKYKDENCIIIDDVLSKISDEIYLYIPFKNSKLSSENFIISIIDTPGSDSNTYKNHMEILKKSLSNQTNSIPIILLERNRIDGLENESLLTNLNEYKEQLDTPNKINVINHADNISVLSLKNQNDSDVINKFKNSKLIYVSSIIALGAKKNNEPWLNKESEEAFDDNKSQFLKGHKNLRELYLYNNLPEKDKEEIRNESGKEKTDEIGELYYNSGIYAVEYEINKFAERYANFHKAEKANKYLLEALDLIEIEKLNLQRQLSKKNDDYKQAREDKKISFISSLEKVDFDEECFLYIVVNAVNEFESAMESFKEKLKIIVKEKWDNFYNQNIKGCDATRNFHEEMIESCNVFYGEIFPKIKRYIENEFEEMQGHIIRCIINLIKNDEDFSEENKSIIIKTIISPPLFEAEYNVFKLDKKAFSKKYILFGKEIIRPKKYAKALTNKFSDSITDDCFVEPYEKMEKDLTYWLRETREKYIKEIDTMSLVLKKYDADIKLKDIEIGKLNIRISNLSEIKKFLSSYLKFRESEENKLKL